MIGFNTMEGYQTIFNTAEIQERFSRYYVVSDTDIFVKNSSSLSNFTWTRKWQMSLQNKQECIPIGCVPSAAVAICWGMSASVHAGIHPLGLGLDTPQAWAWTPPLGRHPPEPGDRHPLGRHPLGPGPRHAPGQTPPVPVNRMTDRCKNISFANFVCGR